MIQHKHSISAAMAHNVCDGKGDCSMPCVMAAGLPSQHSAGTKTLYRKVFFLQKEAGQPYNFFGVANQPTLCDLCCYFALNHIIDNYNIYMNMIICPVDPVHLSYDFIIIN